MSEENLMEKRVARHQRQGQVQARQPCGASKDSNPINGKFGGKSGNGSRSSQSKPFQADTRKVGSEVQRNRSFPDKRPLSKISDDAFQQKGGAKSNKWQKKQVADWRADEVSGACGAKLGARYRHFQPSRRTDCYNKEQYLQAICQFVVLEGKDYGVYLKDADALVDWDLIQEVRLFDEDVPACPICLEPPTAAKITRCGHVYCWPCMLHYLALSDKPWRKCPICYDSVYKDQLRSVVSCASRCYKVGDTVEFLLMKREKSSILALPVGSWEELDKPMKVEDNQSKWGKLLTVTPHEACELICERERIELKAAYGDQIDQPERIFIMEALEGLESRLSLLKYLEQNTTVVLPSTAPAAIKDTHCNPNTTTVPRDDRSVMPRDNWSISGTSDEEVSPLTDKQVQFFLPEPTPEPEHFGFGADGSPEEGIRFPHISEGEPGVISAGSSGKQPSSPEDRDRFYYFYQAFDGQRIFLHPVNVRCLIAEYGSLKHSPERIKGKILEQNRIIMDEDTRRRFKPLGHLPLTTTFTLAELKLDYGILSRITVEMFSEEFRRRKDARQKKARREKYQERKVEQWHQTLLAQQRADCGYAVGLPEEYRSRSGNPEIPYIKYVPSAQNDILAQTSPSSPTDAPQPPIVGSPDEAIPGTSSDADDSQHMSFAQMLKLGKRRTEEPVSALPSSASIASIDPNTQLPGTSSGDGRDKTDVDNEESCPAPDYKDAFGDALAAAIDAINMDSKERDMDKQEDQVGKSRKGKKGKKSRGKLLFSM